MVVSILISSPVLCLLLPFPPPSEATLPFPLLSSSFSSPSLLLPFLLPPPRLSSLFCASLLFSSPPPSSPLSLNFLSSPLLSFPHLRDQPRNTTSRTVSSSDTPDPSPGARKTCLPPHPTAHFDPFMWKLRQVSQLLLLLPLQEMLVLVLVLQQMMLLLQQMLLLLLPLLLR